jgi:hypothetical protein
VAAHYPHHEHKVIRGESSPQKDVKNEGRSGDVYENKGLGCRPETEPACLMSIPSGLLAPRRPEVTEYKPVPRKRLGFHCFTSFHLEPFAALC